MKPNPRDPPKQPSPSSQPRQPIQTAQYPTFKQVSQQASDDLDKIIGSSSRLPKDLIKRLKTLLLFFEPADVLPLLCLNDTAAEAEIREYLKKVAESGYRSYAERWERRFKEKITRVVNQALLREEKFSKVTGPLQGQYEENRSRMCTSLLQKRSYESLSVFDSDDSNFLTQPQKDRLFTHFHNLIQVYYEQPPLQKCLQQFLQALVEVYSDADRQLISEVVTEIVKSKDPELRSISQNPRLKVSHDERAKLIQCIQKSELYQLFCETDERNRDIVEVRNRFQRELVVLLRRMTTIGVYRRKVAEDLINDPSDSIQLNYLSAPALAELQEQLKKLQSRIIFKQLKDKQIPNLPRDKADDIKKIISKAGVDRQNGRQLAESLNKFEILNFLQHPAIANKWPQLQQTIYSEDCRYYRLAMKANDINIPKAEKASQKTLYLEIMEKMRNESRELEELASKAIRDGETIEIEKYWEEKTEKIRNLITSLEQNETFQSIRKSKSDDTLANKIRIELQLEVASFVKSPKQADQIVTNLLRFNSTAEIDITPYVCEQSKAELKKSINKCNNFTKYVRLWSEDLDKCQELMENVFVVECRKLGIGVNLHEKLRKEILAQKNLEAVKSEPMLSEVTRKLLLKFFEDNEECRAYLNSCHIERMVLAIEALKIKIQQQFDAMDKNQDNIHFLETIIEIVLDFCQVNSELNKIQWEGIKVSSLLGDDATKRLLDNINKSDQFKQFRLFYPLYLRMQLDQAKLIFQRYFTILLQINNINLPNAYKTLQQCKFSFSDPKKLFPGLRPIQQKSLTQKCTQSLFYQKLSNLLQATSLRKRLLSKILLQNRIDQFKQSPLLAQLQPQNLTKFLQELKNEKLEGVYQSQEISERKKQGLVKELAECEEFAEYVRVTEEVNKGSEISLFVVGVRNYHNPRPERGEDAEGEEDNPENEVGGGGGAEVSVIIGRDMRLDQSVSSIHGVEY